MTCWAGSSSPGACEFEHILNTEIVDGICTLLGHPRECPHGFPIPEGECCRVSARYVRQIDRAAHRAEDRAVARVAYVYTQSDQQLHRLTSLQITPGTVVKLHQAYPSYVIECEGASIALDDEVARSINVWVEGEAVAADPAPVGQPAAGRTSPGRSGDGGGDRGTGAEGSAGRSRRAWRPRKKTPAFAGASLHCGSVRT